MAVFQTNLVIYTHTDFEQTFVLEDSQSNSAKDLTGFTGVARMKPQFQGVILGDVKGFTLAFTNRTLGKIRMSASASDTANFKVGKHFYEIVLTNADSISERVIEGIVIVKQPVTWPSPPPENPFTPQVP